MVTEPLKMTPLQEAWLKPWIDFCTKQKMMATSDFKSDLAKLGQTASKREVL